MDELWKAAIGIAGLGAVASFVVWSLYKKWLSLPIFQQMTKEQQYSIFRLFLILTFLFGIAALVVYAVTRSKLNEQAANQPERGEAIAPKQLGEKEEIGQSGNQLAKLENYKGSLWMPNQKEDKEGRPRAVFKLEAAKTELPPPSPAPDDPLDRGFFSSVSFDLVNLSRREDVIVRSIQISYRPILGHWVPVQLTTTHPNIRPPVRFLAHLKNETGKADVVWLGDNNQPIVDHLLKLTKTEPRVRIVIGFIGDRGPHRVHVAVDLQEDRSDRSLILRTEQCVWVAAVPPKMDN